MGMGMGMGMVIGVSRLMQYLFAPLDDRLQPHISYSVTCMQVQRGEGGAAMSQALQHTIIYLLRPPETEQLQLRASPGDRFECSAAESTPGTPPVV